MKHEKWLMHHALWHANLLALGRKGSLRPPVLIDEQISIHFFDVVE